MELDPIQKLAEVARLRAQADALEAEAYTEALERHRWLIGPTAQYLGRPATSMQTLLFRGRLRSVGELVLQQREREGWAHGTTLQDLAVGSRSPSATSGSSPGPGTSRDR
jgi:hypothetical protein